MSELQKILIDKDTIAAPFIDEDNKIQFELFRIDLKDCEMKKIGEGCVESIDQIPLFAKGMLAVIDR